MFEKSAPEVEIAIGCIASLCVQARLEEQPYWSEALLHSDRIRQSELPGS